MLAVTGAWLALASSASADAAPAVAGNPVVDQAARSAAGVRQYWTAARMKSALPVTLDKGSATASATSAPEARSAARRRTTATRVPHVRSRNTRAHGKVFFSAGVYDYQCSGTAVRSPSRSLVFTAGHCGYLLVAPGLGNAIHNWEFVPAYDRGTAPYGKWPAKSLAAPQGWLASTPPPVIGPTGEPLGGDSRYDVGAAIVAKRHHRTLQKVVAGRRVPTMMSRRGHWPRRCA